MFMNFYFCWRIDFFYFQVFLVLSLKRRCIGIFENAIVYSCMWSTRVNIFSANWGEAPPDFDKNDIFWVEFPPTQKVKEYPCPCEVTLINSNLIITNYKVKWPKQSLSSFTKHLEPKIWKYFNFSFLISV